MFGQRRSFRVRSISVTHGVDGTLNQNYVIVTSSLRIIAIQSLSSVGKADFHLAWFILKLFCDMCCEYVCLSL